MVIFHSYVKLPEGSEWEDICCTHLHVVKTPGLLAPFLDIQPVTSVKLMLGLFDVPFSHDKSCDST